MTVWHWVRHGPTHARTFVGWRDLPADLSDAAMIERVKTHLPERAVILSSDLSRAHTTAAALNKPGYQRLANDPHLREIHFGIWDGMHFEKVSERDPELSRAFWENPGDIAAPSGESWNQTQTRVNAVVDRINHRYPDHHIVAVAHFGVILTQVQRAMRISPYEAFGHKIDNLSITRIRWTNGQASAEAINHCP